MPGCIVHAAATATAPAAIISLIRYRMSIPSEINVFWYPEIPREFWVNVWASRRPETRIAADSFTEAELAIFLVAQRRVDRLLHDAIHFSHRCDADQAYSDGAHRNSAGSRQVFAVPQTRKHSEPHPGFR